MSLASVSDNPSAQPPPETLLPDTREWRTDSRTADLPVLRRNEVLNNVQVLPSQCELNDADSDECSDTVQDLSRRVE